MCVYIGDDDEVGGISGLLLACLDSHGLTSDSRALVAQNILFSGLGSGIPGIYRVYIVNIVINVCIVCIVHIAP